MAIDNNLTWTGFHIEAHKGNREGLRFKKHHGQPLAKRREGEDAVILVSLNEVWHRTAETQLVAHASGMRLGLAFLGRSSIDKAIAEHVPTPIGARRQHFFGNLEQEIETLFWVEPSSPHNALRILVVARRRRQLPIGNPIGNDAELSGGRVEFLTIRLLASLGKHRGHVGQNRGKKTDETNGLVVPFVHKRAMVAKHEFAAFASGHGSQSVGALIVADQEKNLDVVLLDIVDQGFLELFVRFANTGLFRQNVQSVNTAIVGKRRLAIARMVRANYMHFIIFDHAIRHIGHNAARSARTRKRRNEKADMLHYCPPFKTSCRYAPTFTRKTAAPTFRVARKNGS